MVELIIGQKSSLSVMANSLNPTRFIKYEISSGNLPKGLSLDKNTGDIMGTVRNQSLGNYVFTIKAYTYEDPSNPSFKDFNINIINDPDYKDYTVSVNLFGPSRIDYYTNYINSIYYQYIYRPEDPNFSISRISSINLVNNISNISIENIRNILRKREITTLYPKGFKYSSVLDNYNQKICECVYLYFEDTSRLASNNFTAKISNPPSNYNGPLTYTIWPGGIFNSRNDLIDNLNASETYENWMNIDFTTDIDNNQFISPNHNLIVGDKIKFIDNGLFELLSPFAFNVWYYVIPNSNDTFKLSYIKDLENTMIPITYNINEYINISGQYQTYIIGIPFVFCKVNVGDSVSTGINKFFNEYFLKNHQIELNLDRISLSKKERFYPCNIVNSVIYLQHNFSLGDSIKFIDPYPNHNIEVRNTLENIPIDDWVYVVPIDGNSFKITSIKEDAYKYQNYINITNDITTELVWENEGEI